MLNVIVVVDIIMIGVWCRPVGRPHSQSWVLKVLGQMWADKCAQDVADPNLNANKTVPAASLWRLSQFQGLRFCSQR